MTYYYGINDGDGEFAAVSSSASTTGKDVEIVVNNTNVQSRQELLNAVTNLINFILRSNWPL
jgi:hypothetical protein